MSKKTQTIDVENTQLVEEVHERIDALLQILIEKEVISQHDYDKKLKEILEEKYN